jgi:putative endonuclease
MYFTYILRSQFDLGYYIGSTQDCEARVKYHNAGYVKATRNRRPFELIYFESYENRSEAMRREKQIKSYKGGSAFKVLLEKAETKLTTDPGSSSDG